MLIFLLYYKKVMNKRIYFYIYFLFLLSLNCFSAHLIENIRIEENQLIADVISSDILVSVFDKDYNFINSAYSVNSAIKMSLETDKLENLRIISVKIPEKPVFSNSETAVYLRGSLENLPGYLLTILIRSMCVIKIITGFKYLILTEYLLLNLGISVGQHR